MSRELVMWKCKSCGDKPCFLILTDGDSDHISEPEHCPWHRSVNPGWVLVARASWILIFGSLIDKSKLADSILEKLAGISMVTGEG